MQGSPCKESPCGWTVWTQQVGGWSAGEACLEFPSGATSGVARPVTPSLRGLNSFSRHVISLYKVLVQEKKNRELFYTRYEWDVILTYQVPQQVWRDGDLRSPEQGWALCTGWRLCRPLSATSQMEPKVGTVSTWLVTPSCLPPLSTPTGFTTEQSRARLGRGAEKLF